MLAQTTTSYAAAAWSSRPRRGYGLEVTSDQGRRGKRLKGSRESVGRVSGLEDVLSGANRRRRSTGPKVEEGGGVGVRGRPAARVPLRRRRRRRWSSWTVGKARRWLWPRRTASVAMVAFGHGCGKRGGRARKEGGKNRGGRGVSRRGDREEVEPPARSRRWSLHARALSHGDSSSFGVRGGRRQ